MPQFDILDMVTYARQHKLMNLPFYRVVSMYLDDIQDYLDNNKENLSE